METIGAKAVRAITESDLFHGVSGETAELLARSATLVRFDAHEWIVQAGQQSAAIHILESGIVAMAAPVDGGRYAVLSVRGPGRAFGWSSLLPGGAYLTSAYTLMESSAWAVPLQAVRALLEADTRVAVDVYRNAFGLTHQSLVARAVQLTRTEESSPMIERCPSPGATCAFQWKLSGGVIMARCTGSGNCGEHARSACPLAQQMSTDWTPFMLRRFVPVPSMAVLRHETSQEFL